MWYAFPVIAARDPAAIRHPCTYHLAAVPLPHGHHLMAMGAVEKRSPTAVLVAALTPRLFEWRE